MLPAWLGSGEAFATRLEEPDGLARLREMRDNWPFFGTYLDMLEMLLAKADLNIAEYYEHRLVDEPALQALGSSVSLMPAARAVVQIFSWGTLQPSSTHHSCTILTNVARALPPVSEAATAM